MRNKIVSKRDTTYTNRQYWGLAFPLLIAGITTPIIGAVDTAVVGRLPDPSAIGGVAIGAVIFNTMYWLLGFLRVSTSGFTAQANGAGNEKECILSLMRPTILALFFGLLFIAFQQPILHVALLLFGGNESVSAFASTYFSIRIWGAPFILLSYCFVGWLIGMGRVRLSLATQLVMNVLNIALSIIFVLVLDFGVAGVAYATLIAEIVAVLFGGGVLVLLNKRRLAMVTFRTIIEPKAFFNMLSVNRDHFLRTGCLLIMTGIFTAQGAAIGEITLAANAILLQIHYIMAYLIGGFANASSILSGKAIGGKNPLLFTRTYSLSAQWGFFTALLMGTFMLLFGEQIISLFTSIEEVKAIAIEHVMWMVIFPLLGFWGLMLEGIFAGATDSKSVRNAIFFALLGFLLAIWVLVPVFGNNGIWFAFVLFSFFRSVFLWMYIPGLNRRKFELRLAA